MFYHPGDNKASVITKHTVFWASLALMTFLFIVLFKEEVKIPQKQITVKIDIANKINICHPDLNKDSEKSYFDF